MKGGEQTLLSQYLEAIGATALNTINFGIPMILGVLGILLLFMIAVKLSPQVKTLLKESSGYFACVLLGLVLGYIAAKHNYIEPVGVANNNAEFNRPLRVYE